jgi:hypothetical protein
MPCDSSQGMGDAYREDPESRRRMEAMKKELDSVTSILCSLLHSLDGKFDLPADCELWWRRHQKWDKSQGR